MHADWLRPAWAAQPRVGAVATTRAGGRSRPPFDSMNLGQWVGDAPEAVAGNMALLADAIGARPVFLKQVHGARVVRLEDLPQAPGAEPVTADASFTLTPGLACVVTVADCLPVLFAAPEGRGVAAAHAGWRGLAGGVLDRTVEALCAACGCEPSSLVAWLGPCIGPTAFEVGVDVLHAFGADIAVGHPARFAAAPSAADGSARWWADLPGLARDRLRSLGVSSISGGTWCTVSEPSRFFSYRRDRITGRMAAAVWIG